MKTILFSVIFTLFGYSVSAQAGRCLSRCAIDGEACSNVYACLEKGRVWGTLIRVYQNDRIPCGEPKARWKKHRIVTLDWVTSGRVSNAKKQFRGWCASEDTKREYGLGGGEE